jgi:hypothetical protein
VTAASVAVLPSSSSPAARSVSSSEPSIRTKKISCRHLAVIDRGHLWPHVGIAP